MNTLNFLDANVWLALLWSRHTHSEEARSWFEKSKDEQFFFCRFTQITVPRLLTTEKITFDRALKSRGEDVLVL